MSLQQNVKPISGKKERNSNIELLRIIAMLFVVILHYNNQNNGKAFLYTESLPQHFQVLVGFEIAAICAVNIFIMITGYFMCNSRKADVTKILKLYADVTLLAVLRYSHRCITGKLTFSLSSLLYAAIPLSWYVAVYSALYLISPYLNRMIRGLTAKQFRTLLLVCLSVFSVWPSVLDLGTALTGIKLTSLCPLGTGGSGAGYTIVNFILMYLIGAYLKMHGKESSSPRSAWTALGSYLVCTALLILYSKIYYSGSLSYCNPLVIAQSISIFKVFQPMKIKSRLINEIASCCFGVFLLHVYFLKFFRIETFVTGHIAWIPVHLLFTIVCVFMISGASYWIYQKVIGRLIDKGLKLLSFLKYEVD